MNANERTLADQRFVEMALEEGGMPISARWPVSRLGMKSPFSDGPYIEVKPKEGELKFDTAVLEEAVAMEKQLRELLVKAERIQSALANSLRDHALSKAG